MRPLIYLDLNALIYLQRSSPEYRRKVNELVESERVQFVLSPWHWVEIASDHNQQRFLDLAIFAESLNPKWLPDRRELQRMEVHASFYEHFKIPFVPPPKLRDLLTALRSAENGIPLIYGQPFSLAEVTRVFASHLAPIENAQKQNMRARELNIADLREGRIPADFQRKVLRKNVEILLPDATPEGIVIRGSEKIAFLDAFELTMSPTLAVETALFEDGVKFESKLKFNNFCDLQHLNIALVHSDLFVTDDDSLIKRASRIKSQLPFPTAEVCSRMQFDSRFGLG